MEPARTVPTVIYPGVAFTNREAPRELATELAGREEAASFADREEAALLADREMAAQHADRAMLAQRASRANIGRATNVRPAVRRSTALLALHTTRAAKLSADREIASLRVGADRAATAQRVERARQVHTTQAERAGRTERAQRVEQTERVQQARQTERVQQARRAERAQPTRKIRRAVRRSVVTRHATARRGQRVMGLGNGMTAVVAFARSQVGKRYVSGGEGPGGFDCSGFTKRAYARVGLRLPHSSTAQAARARVISRRAARPGDLVIGSGHVGIYMGRGMMIDAGNRRTGVVYRKLYNGLRVARL
ncbi:MAG TPA: NlpC/P60 family protein [Actinoplanes sp.]